MQFLSPVQLLIVLWLLAAAAPAATVLMNGSFLPTAAATRHGEAGAVAESERTQRLSTDCDVARLVAEFAEWDGKTAGELELIRCLERGAEAVVSTPDSSVLQTAVQRRRPKIG